ncbi:MAG: Cof-type HAD-IIB family hydrolase [Myxococcales bacterium]
MPTSRPAPNKLFATDLDGTLLIPGDTIHPNDVAAIQRAREQGVVVTLATGRLTSRTHPIARVLGLDAPLICADGGVLACSTTERVLARRAVDRELSQTLLDHFARGSLASFVFTHEAIHTCQMGSAHHSFVRGWAHEVTTHQDLRVGAFRGNDDAIMLLGIGEADAVSEVEQALHPYEALVDTFRFELGGTQVVRLLAKGTSKGAALSELAQRLEIEHENTAVIGDWLNDLSMFEYAARSFAMPQSPHELKRAATDVLREDDIARGPIASALERWLTESS